MTTNSVKILLVDDLQANLSALEAVLRRGDIEIFQATSGTEALGFMILHEFALALIDVRMPIMSGFELAELMRGAKKTRNIPIIFVTATAKDRVFSFKGYESGAVDFLLKPLDTHAVRGKADIFIELFRQKRELKRIQAELEKAVQIRDDFLAMLSHELRTPLTAILSWSQLLQMGILDAEKTKQGIDIIERSAKSQGQLIDDLLDIARIHGLCGKRRYSARETRRISSSSGEAG